MAGGLLLARLRAGVVGVAGGHLSHHSPQMIEQFVCLRPSRRCDQHLAAHAVEAAVVQLLGGDAFGLKA